MSRLWIEGTPIEVVMAQGQWPTQIKWERHLHLVEHIEEYWLADFGWWRGGGYIARDYFLLTTTSGLLMEIFRNLVTEAWYLQRLYD